MTSKGVFKLETDRGFRFQKPSKISTSVLLLRLCGIIPELNASPRDLGARASIKAILGQPSRYHADYEDA